MDRKDSHIDLCLNQDVEFMDHDANGFARLRFDHEALPEISFDQIDTSSKLLGKTLSAPLIIGSMTGGTDQATELNKRLARAAEICGVGFAFGSQRKLLENPDLAPMFDARSWAPKLKLLFGNLGAIQLNHGATLERIRALAKTTDIDALFLHLNSLQETVQPEGQTDFRGLLKKIDALSKSLKKPVLVKEVGCGFSLATAKKLSKTSISGIETAGLGGTSWSKIESLRTKDAAARDTGETFSRWGIPTAESIVNCRKALGKAGTVIASGGLRTGIDIAKSLALGADAAAIALPFLRAAERSENDAVLAIQTVIRELKTAMFLTGSKTIAELRTKPLRQGLDFTSIRGGSA